MLWILFSILSALTFALVNIIDKYVITKLVKTPIIPLIFLGIIGLIVSSVVYFVQGFSPLPYIHIALALFVGFIYITYIMLYYKAIQIESVSRIMPLLYLSSMFVLIFAAVFLGEVFAPITYLGIFLMIIGAIMISFKKGAIRITSEKAFIFMIIVAFLCAVSTIIMKYLLNFADFWTIFSYIRIGSFIAITPIFCLNFKDFSNIIKKRKKVVGVIICSRTVSLVARLLLTIALSLGYVTLVNALTSVQPFFVFLYATILSVFYPKILKEELRKEIIGLKLIAIIMIFVGAILII